MIHTFGYSLVIMSQRQQVFSSSRQLFIAKTMAFDDLGER